MATATSDKAKMFKLPVTFASNMSENLWFLVITKKLIAWYRNRMQLNCKVEQIHIPFSMPESMTCKLLAFSKRSTSLPFSSEMKRNKRSKNFELED